VLHCAWDIRKWIAFAEQGNVSLRSIAWELEIATMWAKELDRNLPIWAVISLCINSLTENSQNDELLYCTRGIIWGMFPILMTREEGHFHYFMSINYCLMYIIKPKGSMMGQTRNLGDECFGNEILQSSDSMCMWSMYVCMYGNDCYLKLLSERLCERTDENHEKSQWVKPVSGTKIKFRTYLVQSISANYLTGTSGKR
jgi:hypothetical protein